MDELAQASQDMQDMRNCYDSLLSAAAATTNSVYGKVLLMLGKVQFELQKLVDSYRSHISQTITIPSESLLQELRTVEEMKRQCDEKRNLYEDMITRSREKGRLRSGKGESFSSQQLQAARDDYDEEATLFVFRMKSLKQGQSRSLLTQAARHHASQLCFFKKALKSLEAVEPHVKLVTELHHIDYQFSGLEDDDGDDADADDDDDDDDNSYDSYDDGELSFDYGQNEQGQDVDSASRNSMELDELDITFPQASATAETAKENLDKSHRVSFGFSGERVSVGFSGEFRPGSQSAPLFAEKKLDPGGQKPPLSTRKFHTYVLPTPSDTKSSISTGSGNPVPQTRRTSLSGHSHNLWHSSPLEPKKYEKNLGHEKFSGPMVLNAHSVLKESNNNTKSSRLPPPLVNGLSTPQFDPRAASGIKKIKRQAFSGPLTSKSWSTKPIISASGPLVSMEHPQLFSGPLLRNPTPQPSSSPPKVSPSTSPSFVSSPKISELHELPRPPDSLPSKYLRSSGLVGHSAPLVSRGQELSAINKLPVSKAASPLPTPPQTVHRSLSIPSSGPRETVLLGSKLLEGPHISEMTEDVTSPPLTPISLSNIPPVSTAETVIRDDQIRGAG
ncbi:hypothetical protein L1049_006865 [Liquidambar formosana]|uniref:BAR domain-containing protein n=1 Tax=Liquidambar formosana TaxID=63359 RepID=A0AAP0RG65_LIQFO